MAVKKSKRVLALEAQSSAVATAAIAPTSQAQQDQLFAAAATLKQQAHNLANRESAPAGAVVELHALATPAEMREARRRSSVKRGADVFLPSWSELVSGLPNILVRSDLFSASSVAGSRQDAVIAVQGDVSMTHTGPALTVYDRRVYASCLDAYSGDRPLAPGDDAAWISYSFYHFITAVLNLAYGVSAHQALLASLRRLNAASLRVRADRLDVPVPRLIDVAFDSPAGENTTRLRGSDTIHFRVQEPVAQLFGVAQWTPVPKAALAGTGLAGWLATFYSTHSAPHLVPVATLHERSGLSCRPNDFTRLLKAALDKLASPDTPASVRVSKFTISSNNALRVELLRWQPDNVAALS